MYASTSSIANALWPQTFTLTRQSRVRSSAAIRCLRDGTSILKSFRLRRNVSSIAPGSTSDIPGRCRAPAISSRRISAICRSWSCAIPAERFARSPTYAVIAGARSCSNAPVIARRCSATITDGPTTSTARCAPRRARMSRTRSRRKRSRSRRSRSRPGGR